MQSTLLNNLQFKLHPSTILIYLIMISLAFSTYFIKSNAGMIPSCQKIKAPIKAYSLMPIVFVMFALNDVIAPSILQHMGGFVQSAGAKILFLWYSVRSCFDSSSANPFFDKYLYHVESFLCSFGCWICNRYRPDTVSQCGACSCCLLWRCLFHRYCQHILPRWIYDQEISKHLFLPNWFSPYFCVLYDSIYFCQDSWSKRPVGVIFTDSIWVYLHCHHLFYSIPFLY